MTRAPNRSSVRCTFAIVLLAVSVGALLGCAPKRVSNIGVADALSSPYLPYGVLGPDAGHPAAGSQGLYPAAVPNDRMCCWTSTVAHVVARKMYAARTAYVTLYLPDFAFFGDGRERVTVAIDGMPAVSKCCLTIGVHRLRFPLSNELARRMGDVRITLITNRPFVPKREGVNTDERALGVVLARVDFIP